MILIVDDDQKTLDFLAAYLAYRDYRVLTAVSDCEALEQLEGAAVQMVLANVRMPRSSGLAFIKQAKMLCPGAVSIAYAPYIDEDFASHVLEAGALYFLTKPFDLEKLSACVTRGLEHQALQATLVAKKPKAAPRHRFANMVGESANMLELFETVEKVAASDSTVLIQGESGTGKELVAQAIHDLSDRAAGRFIAVNCAAIPDDLLESELFGHVKGSFTGAVANRVGRFELADRGTLFLDEIGDMKPSLQVKLLRVLQSKEVEPVGATAPKKVDVRIIAATHQNLEQMMAAKIFREDLYYRLSVIPLRLPPLRERAGDVEALINHFLRKFNVLRQKGVLGLDREAAEMLLRYPWPGNVRELENLMERLVITVESGVIAPGDLPEKYRSAGPGFVPQEPELPPSGPISLNDAVEEFETSLILQALEKSGGNQKEAARLLNLKRTTLIEKLKKRNLLANREVHSNAA